MQSDFQQSNARVLVYEGGKVNDSHDPGGKTNQGVTQSTFQSWLRSQGKPVRDVFTMMDIERDAIYKTQYWDKIFGDTLPVGVDFAVYDAAVNSGPGQAAKWLQAAIGTIDVDGVLGPKTFDALTNYNTQDKLVSLIEGICSRRLATLKRLPTWAYFGAGWSARVANVQKTAISWVDALPEPENIALSGVGSAKGNIATIKPPIVSSVTTSIVAGAGVTATVAAQAATQVAVLGDTFSWVKYVLAGLTLLSVGAGLLAALTSKANAAAVAGTATAVVDLDADNLPLRVAQAQVQVAATLPPTQTKAT